MKTIKKNWWWILLVIYPVVLIVCSVFTKVTAQMWGSHVSATGSSGIETKGVLLYDRQAGAALVTDKDNVNISLRSAGCGAGLKASGIEYKTLTVESDIVGMMPETDYGNLDTMGQWLCDLCAPDKTIYETVLCPDSGVSLPNTVSKVAVTQHTADPPGPFDPCTEKYKQVCVPGVTPLDARRNAHKGIIPFTASEVYPGTFPCE